MYLKWEDYSGVSHVIDGITRASSYGSRHFSSSDAISFALTGMNATRPRSFDVFYASVEDAVQRGHTINRDQKSPDERLVVHSTCVLEPGDEPTGAEHAAWTNDGVDPDRVSIVAPAERSYGVCVAIERERGAIEVLHLDATKAWVMSDQGTTVDRINCGVLHGVD